MYRSSLQDILGIISLFYLCPEVLNFNVITATNLLFYVSYLGNSSPLSGKILTYIFFQSFKTLLFMFRLLNMLKFLSNYGVK